MRSSVRSLISNYQHYSNIFCASLSCLKISFIFQTLPPKISASSGSLLLLLYSDTNYVLAGFEAEYWVTDCPHNCSDHGQCRHGKCFCNPKYGGPDCSLSLCPNDCGNAANWGNCTNTAGRFKCWCNQGFVGDDCSLNEKVGYLHFNFQTEIELLIFKFV